MRVMALNHLDQVGVMQGAERALLENLRLWSSEFTELEVAIISPSNGGSFTQQVELDGFELFPAAIPWWFRTAEERTPKQVNARMLAQATALGEISQIISDWKPDVVITNTIVAPWAAMAAAKMGIPHVWFVHEFGDLSDAIHYQLGEQSTFRGINELSNVVVANSELTYEYMLQFIPELKAEIIPPFLAKTDAMDSQRLQPPQNSKDSIDGPFKVVMLGHVTPNKNQKMAINAVSNLVESGYNLELNIYGSCDASYREELETIIRLSPGSQKAVKFHDAIADVSPVINDSDLILSIADRESFGRTILEAQLLGKPVIASETSGAAHMLADSPNLFTIPVDEVSLTEQIEACAASIDESGASARAAALNASQQNAKARASSLDLFKKLTSLTTQRHENVAIELLSNWSAGIYEQSAESHLQLANYLGEISRQPRSMWSIAKRVLSIFERT